MTVEFANLSNGDEVEEWYVLSGVTPVGEWGTVRLRTRYLHDLIMPEEEYSPLKGLSLSLSVTLFFTIGLVFVGS